ncbi:hypothetical protein SH528x_002759 [Novipirellula sp. SH528]|uniref:hypothetical protein n=1 Tax=Novipirellula sp. SH528 TaxID=3454466 RepID=UPI003FA0705E
MKFSLRDILWSTAIIAMIAGFLVTSRQHVSQVRLLSGQLADARKQSGEFKDEAAQAVDNWRHSVAESKQIQEVQSQEILSLRELLKRSLGDQRDWFELQVKGNRIIAIGPATSDSVEVTPRIVDIAERKTGLDGQRLRRLLTPIEQLKLGR